MLYSINIFNVVLRNFTENGNVMILNLYTFNNILHSKRDYNKISVY